MATGDSVIRVSIIGDATKLTGALKDADKATGGLLVSGAKVLGGALLVKKGVDAVFDTVQDGLEKADNFHDALDRIERLTTPEFANQLEAIAFSMTGIGLSADEVGTLAANFDAFAVAAGVSLPTILEITPHLLELASAIAASTGKTVDEVITDIGKAAMGNQKSVSDYGIVVDKALNPDARILDILAQADILFPKVSDATDDLAGSQDTLGAKWDNFTIKLGEALEGPLKGVVDWMIDTIDMAPHAIEGFEQMGEALDQMARKALSPLGNLNDALKNIGDLAGDIAFNLTHIGTGAVNEGAVLRALQNNELRNGQGRGG